MTSNSPIASGGQDTQVAAADPLEPLDPVVRTLFEVTFDLAACAGVADQPVQLTVASAIERIDWVIGELRRVPILAAGTVPHQGNSQPRRHPDAPASDGPPRPGSSG